MQRTLFSIFIGCLALCTATQAAKEILLRLQPAAEAPVIAKITASRKVILDAAPAPKNAELGWRQLALPTPFEGYVPVATLSKNFEIVEGSPVYYLPTTESATITRVETGDPYEVLRVKEEWATVRFQKNITGYFIDEGSEEISIDFDAIEVPLVSTQALPAPVPQPVTIPAPRIRINPDEPISQLDPNALPKENVVWKPTTRNPDPTTRTPDPATRNPNPESRNPDPATRNPDPESRTPDPESRTPDPESQIPNPIMVTPAQTQARESAPELGPAKTPRLLTGILEREISISGHGYPIRLKSPEGRVIAYVDFSEIYINDLSPYIGQKVYIRGQVYPLPDTRAQLVILADSLRLSE